MTARERRAEDTDLQELVVGIVAYLLIGLVRPSWINRHVHLSFAQHFRRLFLTRVVVLVVIPALRAAGERSEDARTQLREELGREPTMDEMVARNSQ